VPNVKSIIATCGDRARYVCVQVVDIRYELKRQGTELIRSI